MLREAREMLTLFDGDPAAEAEADRSIVAAEALGERFRNGGKLQWRV